MNGQQHLHKALERCQEVVGLVEDAMPQTGAHKDADEAVDEQGVEQLVLYLLFFIQAFHHKVGQQQSDEPAQGVPAEGHRPDGESL